MDTYIQGIGQALNGIFSSSIVQLGLRAVGIYFLILWVAAAYWAYRDLQGRTNNPIAPYLASSLIIVSNVFFPLAVVVYRIIRPHDKIGEVNERSLAEEALLNEVEAILHCAACKRRVHEDWLICPSCRTRLHRVCPNCNRLVGLDWSLCAWCGRDFERRELPAARQALPAAAQVPRVSMAPEQARLTAPAGSIPSAAMDSRTQITAAESPRPQSRPRTARAPAAKTSRRPADPLPEH